MKDLLSFLASEKWTPLAEALLHTIWQGAVVAFLLFLYLKIVPAKKPHLRYAGAIAAMITILMGAFLTWAYLGNGSSQTFAADSIAPPAAMDDILTGAQAGNDSLANLSTREVPSKNRDRKGPQSILIFLWVIGVDIMLIRLSLALADLEDLRQNSRLSNDCKLMSQLDSLLRRSRTSVTRLKILVSDQLPSPVAFGFLRPTIVIPISLVTKSPPLLLEAILAHELAHIRRHDYLVNLGQHVIETLLFFNPAVWWISHQIRSEREACCDSDAAKLIGDEIDYAGALADYAASTPISIIPTALPFGQERGSGKLVDRIRRLLIPNYKPTLKLPVGALILFFGLSALILFGLHQGSKMAVAAGAEWLSPEARIAKIKSIQASHPIVAPGALHNGQLAEQPESRVQLSGVIETEDGSPLLTDHLSIQAESRRPKYSASHALGYQDGKFQGRVQPGQLYISAYSPHYAASLQGPFRGEIAGTLTNLVINMKQGFTGTIKLVNEKGAPIANAALLGSYDFPSYAAIPETRSDSKGMAVLPHLISHPMKLSLRANGYQEDHRTITLQGTSPATWILKPAAPTIVTLIDGQGLPISGATAKLIRTDGFQNMSFGARTRRLYASSNQEGQLAFTELRDDSRYWFEVNAEGYGKKILRKLTAGMEDLRITLGQPLVVRGQIEGNLSLLRQRNRILDGKRQKWPVIRYSNPFQTEGFRDSDSDFVFVDIEGEKATFTIEDLWPGEILITAGSQSITFPLTNSLNEIRVNLSKNQIANPLSAENIAPLPKREVHFNFKTPQNQPRANGFAQANISAKQPDGTYDYQDLTLEVKDGSAQHTVTIGSLIRIEPNNFPGYWFTSASEGEIPAGPGPFKMDLTCFPAGAIYGNIREADGRPAVGIMISIVEVQKAPNRPPGSLDIDIKNSSSSSDITETFTATPLPIGGTYIIVAHRDTNYAVSPQLLISQENPVQETTLVMQPGITIRGQVFQPNGEPAAGMTFEHSYNPIPNHGFSTSNKTTDRLGRFTLRGVTPSLPGSYAIRFRENLGYQRHKIVYAPSDRSLVVNLKAGRHITGRVIDSVTGWPIPGIEVYVIPQPYTPERTGYVDADAKTDETGRFHFTTLDSGDYQINARGAKRTDQNQPPVNASSPESGDIQVNLYKWSKLKPVAPVPGE